MTQSPKEMYKRALQERKSPNPLNRRQACEKGWLAVVAAVDAWLATHGKYVPTGTAEAHVKRIKYLGDLVEIDPSAETITRLHDTVANQLHGACFYGGEDSPYFDTVLEKGVKEVLELTGHWDGEE